MAMPRHVFLTALEAGKAKIKVPASGPSLLTASSHDGNSAEQKNREPVSSKKPFVWWLNP
jgi:hypothetical protein